MTNGLLIRAQWLARNYLERFVLVVVPLTGVETIDIIVGSSACTIHYRCRWKKRMSTKRSYLR